MTGEARDHWESREQGQGVFGGPVIETTDILSV